MNQNYASVAYVNFLFGIFCAHWAQNTHRSSWLWFFLGGAFGPLAGIALVVKNSGATKLR